jgi:hypothetical protein
MEIREAVECGRVFEAHQNQRKVWIKQDFRPRITRLGMDKMRARKFAVTPRRIHQLLSEVEIFLAETPCKRICATMGHLRNIEVSQSVFKFSDV